MDEEFEVLQHPDRVSVRNTRSLSRSGIEERIEVIDLSSSGNTGSTYRMSIPSQQRPPPPPPPPPAPAAAASAGTDPGRGNQNLNFSTPQNIATQTNENEPIFHPQDEVEEEEERIELKIRSMNRGEIVKILVTPNLRQEDFANCVAHAALSPVDGMKLFQTWCADEDVVDLSRIAGLFRQRDSVFIPLSVLLRDAPLHVDDIFCISLKGFRRNGYNQDKDARKRSMFLAREMIIYACITSYIAWKLMTGEDVLDLFHRSVDILDQTLQLIVNLPSMVVNSCIEYPLREMYRYGPAVIGWEGQSLPLICSQVTHMGDETFWRKNLDECQKIYDTKEEASLHYRKPLVYMFLAYMLFRVVQSLVRTYAIRRQNKPHPEMVETYEAFRLLMRVIQRALSKIDDGRRGRYR